MRITPRRARLLASPRVAPMLFALLAGALALGAGVGPAHATQASPVVPPAAATLAEAATPVEDPNDPKTMASLGRPFAVPSWPLVGGLAGALLLGVGAGYAWQRRREP